jgi:hypothetical protein
MAAFAAVPALQGAGLGGPQPSRRHHRHQDADWWQSQQARQAPPLSVGAAATPPSPPTSTAATTAAAASPQPKGKFAKVWLAANSSVRDYKEAREKDFHVWILASALVMTVAFSSAIALAARRDSSEGQWWKALLLWLAILSLAASGFLALKCINDFFLYYLLSVNTPPRFYDHVNRHILYDERSCGVPQTSKYVSFECKEHAERPWSTAVLDTLGVKSHHVVFYQSIWMLGASLVLVCTYRCNRLYPLGAALLVGLMATFMGDMQASSARFFTAQDALYDRLWRESRAATLRIT